MAAARSKLSRPLPGATLALAVDDASIYWRQHTSSSADASEDDWFVAWLPVTGGGSPTYVATSSDFAADADVDGLLLQNGQLYWSGAGPFEDCQDQTFGASLIYQFDVTTRQLSIRKCSNGQTIRGIATNSSSLLWLANDDEEMVHLDKILYADGSNTMLSSGGLYGESAFAVDDTWAYWSHFVWAAPVAENQLDRVRLADGQSSTLLTNVSFSSLAVDGASLYAVDDKHTISRVPVTGGAQSTFVSGEASARNLAAHEHYVYWLNGGEDADGQLDGSSTSIRRALEVMP